MRIQAETEEEHQNRLRILRENVVIDEEALQQLPDDGVPDNLPSLDVEENEEETERQEQGPPESNANDAEQESRSFLPLQQAQQREKEGIRAIINGEDPLDWPSNEGESINEFHTEGLATMAFPTLFPYGKADPTNKRRRREVTLTELVSNTSLNMQNVPQLDSLFGDLHPIQGLHIGL